MARKRSGKRWLLHKQQQKPQPPNKTSNLSRLMFPELYGLPRDDPNFWMQPVIKRSSLGRLPSLVAGGHWTVHNFGNKRRAIAVYPAYRLRGSSQRSAGFMRALHASIINAPKGGTRRRTAARDLALIRAGHHNLYSKPFVKGYVSGMRRRGNPNQPRDWHGRWT